MFLSMPTLRTIQNMMGKGGGGSEGAKVQWWFHSRVCQSIALQVLCLIESEAADTCQNHFPAILRYGSCECFCV